MSWRKACNMFNESLKTRSELSLQSTTDSVDGCWWWCKICSFKPLLPSTVWSPRRSTQYLQIETLTTAMPIWLVAVGFGCGGSQAGRSRVGTKHTAWEQATNLMHSSTAGESLYCGNTSSAQSSLNIDAFRKRNLGRTASTNNPEVQ